MNLIDAIKDLISKKGISIVDTKQFVNVLDDVGAFKNEPAASKKVMKGLMDSGFGALVLQYSKRKIVIGRMSSERLLRITLQNQVTKMS